MGEVLGMPILVTKPWEVRRAERSEACDIPSARKIIVIGMSKYHTESGHTQYVLEMAGLCAS